MLQTIYFPGKYIQGRGALNELPNLIKLFGSKTMVISAPSAVKNIINVEGSIFKQLDCTVEQFRRECSENEINRVHDIVKQNKYDVVVGIGGGKLIDVARVVADRVDLPMIIIPTIASTDAPCSACAVIYTDDGEFEKALVLRRNPDVVLVDTDIIAKAPVRFFVAGMGDALATYFEAKSNYLGRGKNEGGHKSTTTGYALAKLSYELLQEYGLLAKLACERQAVTPAFERIVEANTLLSGIGFESVGLGAAHAIHNGLTALPGTHSYQHGEKVAFGTQASLHLNDADPEIIEEVYSFCEQLGLPTTLADIGVTEYTMEDLQKVAEISCDPHDHMDHELHEITLEMVVAAILAADATGTARKMGGCGCDCD